MQDCFRLHPEVYGDELDDDEAPEGAAPEGAGEAPVAKTITSEGDSAPKPEETATSKDNKREEKEVAEIAKETEKQNMPPAQP